MNILLAIPCFNEADRLPVYLPMLLERIERCELPVTVEIVDDGSTAAQREGMEKTVREHQSRYAFLRPLRSLPANRGKGGAVHAAWNAGVETFDWLAFVDADGSLSPGETCRFLECCLTSAPPRTWFASRVQMLGKRVERHYSRHLMGRVFATLVGTLIDNRVYDSQCGLKAVPAAHYRIIQPLLEETRFAFDVELVAALRHVALPAAELPVDWVDVPGSKVKPIRDITSMLRSIFRIRKRRRSWPSILVP